MAGIFWKKCLFKDFFQGPAKNCGKRGKRRLKKLEMTENFLLSLEKFFEEVRENENRTK